jgi:hypothetical protein
LAIGGEPINRIRTTTLECKRFAATFRFAQIKEGKIHAPHSRNSRRLILTPRTQISLALKALYQMASYEAARAKNSSHLLHNLAPFTDDIEREIKGLRAAERLTVRRSRRP